jgi:serine/threonine-protein kinase
MSPEQALGRSEEIDHATDQFALGAITYEMLTGRQAFVGDDPLAVMYRVVNEAPAPLAGKDAGRGTAALEAVLRKAMSKKKRDRYATVSEFARALAAAASGAAEISSGRHEPLVTPAPTMAFGHAPSSVERLDAPETEPAVVADATTLVRRTPTTFRNAAGELSARPVRTGRIVAAAAAVVALVVLMGLLTLSGRPVPVRAGSSPPAKKVAAVPTPPPAPPPAPVEAPKPLPVVEVSAPIESFFEAPPARDGSLRAVRRGRSHAGPPAASRRTVIANAPLVGSAPSPQPPPPPPPPKPVSDLVKGDDL